MRQVYTSQDTSLVGYYKSILDEAGISSFIRNENSNNPEMAGADFFPVLCVLEDTDFNKAIGLITSLKPDSPVHTEEWKCPSCSEINPANFGSCWSCNTLRPEA